MQPIEARPRVLLVDDDSTILYVFKDLLAKNYDVEIANSPNEGIVAVRDRGPFAVIISDLRIPGSMGGAQFLALCAKHAPSSVRMAVTASDDPSEIANAMNLGQLFRVLPKPFSGTRLANEIAAAVQEHTRIHEQHSVVQESISACVKLLLDTLAAAKPAAMNMTRQARMLVKQVAMRLDPPDIWQIELGALLSQIGCVAVPDTIIEKLDRGGRLSPEDREIFAKHPALGGSLVGNIPRMEEVARIIAYQGKQWSGGGLPEDDVKGEDIPLGSRILHAVLDYNILVANRFAPMKAIDALHEREGRYDPRVLSALKNVIDPEQVSYAIELDVDRLKPSMILGQDIITTSAIKIAGRGDPVTPVLIERLRNLVKGRDFMGSVTIEVPAQKTA